MRTIFSPFILTLLAIPAGICAQQHKAVVQGTTDRKELMVIHYMVYDEPTQTKLIDSVAVADGKFSLTVPYTGLATSVMLTASYNGKGLTREDAGDSKSLLINEAGATIYIRNNLHEAVVTNNPLDEEKAKYIRYTYLAAADSAKMGFYINGVSPIIIQYEINKPSEADTVAMAGYNKAHDKANAVNAKMMELVGQKLMLQRKYMKEYPDSYFSLSALKDNIRYGNNLDEIMPMLNGLSERLRNSADAKSAIDLLNKTKEKKLHPEKKEDMAQLLRSKAQSLAIGDMAPAFTLNDVNGKPVQLSAFKGKYVLVDFWASWCVPCRQENPNVVKAYRQYKDRNFTVIGIALEEKGKRDPWLKAIEKDGLPWTQLVDYENAVAGNLYKVHSIPFNFLVDPAGKIIAMNLHGEGLQNKLSEFLSGL